MSQIRSTGNRTTELRLIEIFHELGIKGWRRNAVLSGKPDFIFRRRRLAVFVDGCFWHGCPQCHVPPVNNAEYWAAKKKKNRSRDRKVTAELRRAGWSVIRLWEHSLKDPRRVAARLQRILDHPDSR